MPEGTEQCHSLSVTLPARFLPAPRLSAWPVAVAGGLLAVLVATSGRYGYHRDELYFIAAGGHPAFGYPDQPPLVPLLCRAMQQLAPGSLLILRLPSALAAAVTTLVSALIARELRGTAAAQVLAAGCTAASAITLATGHFVTTTTFDLLSTTVLCWLIIRGLTRRSGPSLLAAGITVGIGVQFKPQVGLVAVIMVAALAITGPRWPLRSRWLIAGAASAIALGAPYVIWQAIHGWPQLSVAATIGGSAEGGRVGFLPFQLVLVSPLLAPIWIVALRAPYRNVALRPVRFLSFTYLTLAVLYLAGDGKAYYLASLYPALLAVGAIPVAAWAQRRPAAASASRSGPRQRRVTMLLAAVLVSVGISGMVALPVVPAADLRGSVILALNPDQAETVGWPDFVHAVAAVWESLPPDQRSHAVIVTDNYGEAGAIDLLGRRSGLPRAYSGHDGYTNWGQPPTTATLVLLLGYGSPEAAAPSFTGCVTASRIENRSGVNNQEHGLPLLLCRPAQPWPQLWHTLTHYG